MKQKILVVEDDFHIRENLSLLLELENFYVRSADSGPKGLKEIKGWNPDLVLSDIRMPGMSGLDLLSRYISESESGPIPFIFLTALNEKEDIRAGMNYGADDYLTKPVSRTDLLHSIRSQLSKKAKREAFYHNKLNDLKKRSEDERNVLLAEIHHRVKNNLALISALTQLNDGETMNDRSRALDQRIKAIAMVHEEMYTHTLFSVVDVELLVRKMVNQLFSENTSISRVLELEKWELDISKAVPLALLMHELLDNVSRHAFPAEQKGEVWIKFKSTQYVMEVNISDNGTGIKGVSCSPNPLGLILVEALCKQIQCSIEKDTAAESGTSYKLILPLA